MKKVSFLFVMALALFAGCKKEVEEVEKILSFDISNSKSFVAPKDDINAAFAIQQQFPDFTMPLPVTGVSSSSEADFQKNGTTTNLVKNIVPKELILTMPDNSTETFSFLQKMDVMIASDSTGKDAVLLAYNNDVPTTIERRLVFTPTGNNMDKFVKAGKYHLILNNVKLRRAVTTNLNITANITFGVTASPL
jgi:hypothetical protein